MICKNCEQEIKSSDIRCPNCGATIKHFFLVQTLNSWGLADVLILIALLCGVCTFFWVYLFGDMNKVSKQVWKVDAQAYEETVGQVKVIGVIKNMSQKTQEGNIVLELRCFDDQGKLIWNEFATMQNQVVEYNQELPLAFVLSKPEGFSYFNVRATTVTATQ